MVQTITTPPSQRGALQGGATDDPNIAKTLLKLIQDLGLYDFNCSLHHRGSHRILPILKAEDFEQSSSENLITAKEAFTKAKIKVTEDQERKIQKIFAEFYELQKTRINSGIYSNNLVATNLSDLSCSKSFKEILHMDRTILFTKLLKVFMPYQKILKLAKNRAFLQGLGKIGQHHFATIAMNIAPSDKKELKTLVNEWMDFHKLVLQERGEDNITENQKRETSRVFGKYFRNQMLAQEKLLNTPASFNPTGFLELNVQASRLLEFELDYILNPRKENTAIIKILDSNLHSKLKSKDYKAHPLMSAQQLLAGESQAPKAEDMLKLYLLWQREQGKIASSIAHSFLPQSQTEPSIKTPAIERFYEYEQKRKQKTNWLKGLFAKESKTKHPLIPRENYALLPVNPSTTVKAEKKNKTTKRRAPQTHIGPSSDAAIPLGTDTPFANVNTSTQNIVRKEAPQESKIKRSETKELNQRTAAKKTILDYALKFGGPLLVTMLLSGDFDANKIPTLEPVGKANTLRTEKTAKSRKAEPPNQQINFGKIDPSSELDIIIVKTKNGKSYVANFSLVKNNQGEDCLELEKANGKKIKILVSNIERVTTISKDQWHANDNKTELVNSLTKGSK